MRQLKRTKQTQTTAVYSRGFTLLELSIVLVIIGLLAGGTLVGKSLIDAAQVRREARQNESLEMQISAFKMKYNCLPGDCAEATNFFGTTDAGGKTILNGNGDGVWKPLIGDGNVPLPPCASGQVGGSELTQLFLQLYNARLSPYAVDAASYTAGIGFPLDTSGTGAGFLISCVPENSIGSWSANPNFANRNTLVMGAQNAQSWGGGLNIQYMIGITTWHDGFGNMGVPVRTVQALDTKLDDGLPLTGRFGVIVAKYTDTTAAGGAPWNSGCFGSGYTSNTYGTASAECLVVAGQVSQHN